MSFFPDRTLVFGDIHGCHRALIDLLALAAPDPRRDRLVFLGDYVDRGPDSRGVIDEILRLKREFRQVVALKGNHEEVLLSFLAGRERDFYLMVGGRQTLESYGCGPPFDYACAAAIPEAHRHFLGDLLPSWEDESHIYVHAGLKAGVHLSMQPSDWLYWAAGGRFVTQRHDFGKRVIFGHAVQQTPLIEPDKVGIDTGAVYGGHLSCLILPEFRILQVKSERFWPVGV
ncbi:MAG: metallophosphoesterase family protein [Thermodesulfobacteriota bacterium]